MTLHLKFRGYPFRPRLLFSGFIAVGVGSPTVYYFRRGQQIRRACFYHTSALMVSTQNAVVPNKMSTFAPIVGY